MHPVTQNLYTFLHQIHLVFYTKRVPPSPNLPSFGIDFRKHQTVQQLSPSETPPSLASTRVLFRACTSRLSPPRATCAPDRRLVAQLHARCAARRPRRHPSRRQRSFARGAVADDVRVTTSGAQVAVALRGEHAAAIVSRARRAGGQRRSPRQGMDARRVARARGGLRWCRV